MIVTIIKKFHIYKHHILKRYDMSDFAKKIFEAQQDAIQKEKEKAAKVEHQGHLTQKAWEEAHIKKLFPIVRAEIERNSKKNLVGFKLSVDYITGAKTTVLKTIVSEFGDMAKIYAFHYDAHDWNDIQYIVEEISKDFNGLPCRRQKGDSFTTSASHFALDFQGVLNGKSQLTTSFVDDIYK